MTALIYEISPSSLGGLKYTSFKNIYIYTSFNNEEGNGWQLYRYTLFLNIFTRQNKKMTNSCCFPVHLFKFYCFMIFRSMKVSWFSQQTSLKLERGRAIIWCQVWSCQKKKKNSYTNHYLFNQQVKIKQ